MTTEATINTSADTSTESRIDGAAFYRSESLHTLFYDTLYGASADRMGDVAWYEALAQQTGPVILEAACGSGRVFQKLAKPGREIHAFDASSSLLQQARARASALADTCPVHVSQQRLESFQYDTRFDLILVPYYGFGNLLDAASRHACLQRIAQHLKPNGRAVIHLPNPQLLSRDVPKEEIDLMRTRHQLEGTRAGNLVLEQNVLGMAYMESYELCWMQINARLLRESGEVLQQHPATLYYACITAEALTSAVNAAGLQVLNIRKGFFNNGDNSTNELIAVLGRGNQEPNRS